MITDEALMLAYQSGDAKAFEELYRRHSGRVLGYLRNRNSKPGEAEDLLQAAFLKLHANRHRYDAGCPFLPWIFAITRNVWIDRMRKRNAETVSLEEAPAEKLAMPLESSDSETWLVDEAMTSLSLDQQNLLKLRFSEGLSFEEISEKTGLNSPSARKRVSRAVQLLRARLLGKGSP